MGRRAAVVRSRKNTNTLRVETVKHLLVNSGIGLSPTNNQHVAGWDDSNAPETMSRSSSLESDEAEYEGTEFDDTYLVTPQIYCFITKQLIRCRIFLLLIQWFFNWIIADFSTDAFKGFEPKNATRRDVLVQSLFGGLARWDARQFLHIAEFDYTWESTLAFFPLFPMLLRVTGTAVQSFLGSISLFNAMIVSGVLINNSLFVVNGLLLFKLCLILTKSTKESLIAVYVFCFNPASIFFSSLYTETIYMSFTLIGLIVLYEQKDYIRFPIASCIFSFAYLTRANGILNVGYIGFMLLLEILVYKDSEDRLKIEQSIWKLAEKSLKRLPLLILCFLIVLLPLRIFGWSMEERYCKSTLLTVNERLLLFLSQNSTSSTLPGNVANMNWCRGDRPASLLFPAYYGEIQSKYWDVGLLRYWQLRKIPMFLMALPTLGFILYGAIDMLLDIGTERRNSAEILSDQRYLIPFVFHSSFIGLTGFFFYNVEVSTRMIYSSSPFLYILLARIMSNQTPRIYVPQDLVVPTILPFFANYIFVRPLHFLMMFYLLGYFFFGTLLHCNWLPFV